MAFRKSGPRGRLEAGFTLLELLIVIAIIAILSSILIPTILIVQVRARVTLANSQIAKMQAALAMYSADTGRFPRRPGAAATADALFKNDVAYLYAALMNNRTIQAGGGPNAPYLDRGHSMAAHAQASDIDTLAFMSVNPADTKGAYWLAQLPKEERDSLNDTPFQVQHLPGKASELVLVDPWGNPYVYREWASVPRAQKEGLFVKRTYQLLSTSGIETVLDRPHDPNGFDLISPGPDGILQYGAGDDICSWQVQK